MIYRTIGKSNISASVVAFGTFPLGGWMWGGCDEKAALNTIAEALDLCAPAMVSKWAAIARKHGKEALMPKTRSTDTNVAGMGMAPT